MTNLTPGVLDAMRCPSASASSGHTATSYCDSHEAGHQLLPLQERVTAATPSKWRDAIVTAITTDGWLELAPLDATEQSAPVRVWNHAWASGGSATSTTVPSVVAIGEPVALHGLYHTLAIGGRQLNVLVDAR